MLASLRAFLEAVNAFLVAYPLVTGFLGWAGATILWESVIKTASARRGLAHMLAEEVGLNLKAAVGGQLQLEYTPRVIPNDFQLSEIAFSALASQAAQLPRSVIGEAILYYQRVKLLNALVAGWGEQLERYRAMQRSPKDFPPIQMELQKATLDTALATYSRSLAVMIEQSDLLLRQLRIASTFGGRCGYLFVRKNYVDPAQARKDLEEHHRTLKALRDKLNPAIPGS